MRSAARGVAKGKGLALVVCGPQIAPLKHLHGKRQREAQGGGVEAELVAQVVGAQHGIQVAHADGRPHGAGNLLVNARRARVEIRAVQRVDALDALVGAAGAAQLHNRAGEIGRFLKGFQPGKRALLIVVGAEGCIQPVEIDPATEAGRLLLPAAQVVARDAAGKVRSQLFQGCTVEDGGMHTWPQHDRLEPLGPHHRAHAHACGLVAPVGDDGGEAHLVFAGWPDGGHVAVGAKAGGQGIRRGAYRLAPQLVRGDKGDGAVFHHQRCGRICLAGDHDGVGARRFERNTPRPLRARLADAAGERAFGGRGEARQARVRVTGGHAGGEDEQVLRAKRVDAGGGVLDEQSRRQQPAAHGSPPEEVIALLQAEGARVRSIQRRLPVWP